MRPKTIAVMILIGLSAGASGLVYLSVQLVGIIDTIAYVVLFGMGATLVPVLIGLGGSALPKFLRVALGKLTLILQMFALNVGVYVQDKYGKWHAQPAKVDGDDVSIWWDGAWKANVTGRENLSRLGLRPFGIVWAKEAGMRQQDRADPETITDGGVGDVRGEISGRTPINPDPDAWLFDARSFKRMRNYARSDIVTRAEQQKLRKEVQHSGVNRWAAAVATLIGIALGGGMALFMTMG